MVQNGTQIADLAGNYTNGFISPLTNVNIFNLLSPNAPILVSGNTNVITVGATPGVPGSATNVITAVGPGTTTVTVNFNSSNYTATITVTLPPGPVLMHEYSFNDLVGSTTITDTFRNREWHTAERRDVERHRPNIVHRHELAVFESAGRHPEQLLASDHGYVGHLNGGVGYIGSVCLSVRDRQY